MTQNTKKWVRRIFFAVISVALVAAAVLLMVQCVAIYRLGGSPFTRESIAQHFAPIAVPVYLCLGLVAMGVVLSPLLPAAPDTQPDRDAVTLRRLQVKTNLDACPADLTHAVCKTRRARNAHHYVTLALLAVGTVIFLWYALDIDHFPIDNINGAMIGAVLLLLPCMGIPALYALFTAYFCRHSVKREIALLRTAPKEAISTAPKAPLKNEDWMPFLQGAVVVIAVGMMVYGLLDNGAAAVLTKAINICTECIGLG